MSRQTLAKAVCRASHLRGQFELRSGARATEYFDKYRFEADPALLRAIGDALAPLIPPDTDALAGLELGGVPIATVLSQITGLPLRFIRKAAKSYGTAQLAEGGAIAGHTLCLIEDVISSGGQAIASATELRALGAKVTQVLCVVDRETGGELALAAAGLSLKPLLRYSDLAPFIPA